ncbi:glycosyltransferase family 4 protein [Candidatus Woesearchaeota archaeon]|nr:glycosyltransferase family 4 protein [Candidatus Woesearchaeota archaeon]
MNFIFVTEYFPTSEKGEISGGVEARCFYLAKELSKKHQVKVITSWKKGQHRKHNIGKVVVERVGPNHEYSNKGSIFSRLFFGISAYKKIKQERGFNFVDGFNFTTYIPAYFGARKIRAKAVATYHETWVGTWIKNKGLLTGLVGEILERTALGLKWDQVIPVSNFTRNKLKCNGIPERKITVVYNGVITDDFKKMKVKKEEKFRIVSVSRLVKTKRIQILLKALQHLKDKSMKCVLVGEGDDREYMKKEAIRLGINDLVEFKGFLKTKEEVIKEIKKSHVFCLPSAVEGFGIAVIEAMASGVPVICSDIAPLKEVTKNGEYGLIFKLDDYKELAEKIKLLKENKNKYSELKRKGLKRANDFEWEKIAQEYLKAVKN